MNLLALDQASKTSGWAFFQDSELKDYGKFTFEDSDIGIRLNKIRDKVAMLIADYDIDYIIFEDIQLQNNVGNNVATFKVLAEVFGVIEELATDLNIPHSAVLAATWKSKLKIEGNVRAQQKKAAQAFVKAAYSISATQDESDAICIGTYFIIKDIKNDPVEDFDWSD